MNEKANMNVGVGTCNCENSSMLSQSQGGLGKSNWINQFTLFVSSTSINHIVKLKLDFYLDESVLPRTNDFSILTWWKVNGIKVSIVP